MNITQLFQYGNEIFAKIRIGNLKRLLKENVGLVYTTFGGVGSSGLGAVFWFILASILSVDNYGLVNYYLALPAIFSGVCIVGLDMTVTTYLAKGEKNLLYGANSMVLISGLIIALVLSAFHWASGILSMAMVFGGMTIAEILGKKAYKEYAFVSIGQRIAQMILSLLLYFQIGILGIIIGYFLGSLIFSYRYLFSLRKFTFKLSNLKEKRNFALHSYGFNLIGGTLSNYMDKVIIGVLFGYYALGLYQLGFQFLMFLNLIPGSLQQYLLPEESSGNSKRQIKIAALTFTAAASIALFTLSPYLVTAFFPTFIDAIPLVSLMSLAVIPSAITSIQVASLLGNEKSQAVLTAGVLYLTTLVISLVIAGALFGAVGLAIAVMTAKTTQAMYLLTKRKISVNTQNNRGNLDCRSNSETRF